MDSWLEALAHRLDTQFGDLQAAVGLRGDAASVPRWLVRLPDPIAATIEAETGVSHAAIRDMTLDRYNNRALRIVDATRRLDRRFPWGPSVGSRYCPHCLAENGGRWALEWRLGWAFACTVHHCLLANTCPFCGQVQRRRTFVGDVVPRPGCCGQPAPDASGRSAARCGADLRNANVMTVDASHPIIRAQEVVRDVINSSATNFGVYRVAPQPPAAVLSDIKALAARILGYSDDDNLGSLLPPDLAVEYRAAQNAPATRSGPTAADKRPGAFTPSQPAVAAAGTVAALDILGHPDVHGAADRMQWLITSHRQRGLAVSPANIGWGKGISPVLSGVQLASLGPLLSLSDQLRHSVGAVLPIRARPMGERQVVARCMPTMLWPAWSLPLSIPVCYQRIVRPALAAAILVVGHKLTLDRAAEALGGVVVGQTVSRVLALYQSHARWQDVRDALLVMANYLAEQEIPIDYERRRALDYRRLLPTDEWTRMSDSVGMPAYSAARARVARAFMFETISGRSIVYDPKWPDSNQFRTDVANFPARLTPALAGALTNHASEFLADSGVADEPVTWSPPPEIFRGLDLPGTDFAQTDIRELHRAVNQDRRLLGTAASAAGMDLDTARFLLSTSPAPSPKPATLRRTRLVRAASMEVLSREVLLDMYENQRMSFAAIAASTGVSRQTVRRIAIEYGITAKSADCWRKYEIERDWLYREYVTKRRALPDIAREIGASTATVARWAKQYEIPIRTRGGPSHSQTLNDARAANLGPELLRPALAGIGGWQRLQRFADASQYRTVTVAAQRLGLSQTTLTVQIQRIERELGVCLLERAQRGAAMSLTREGQAVLEAIHAYAPVRDSLSTATKEGSSFMLPRR